MVRLFRFAMWLMLVFAALDVCLAFVGDPPRQRQPRPYWKEVVNDVSGAYLFFLAAGYYSLKRKYEPET